MKLVAIVYHNAKKFTPDDYTPDYRLVKLFDDGSTQPIAETNHDQAIRYVEERGCRAWGYWINDEPAVAWAPTRQDFERAWGQPVIAAACTFARREFMPGHRRIGSGYLVPTRSQYDILRLRKRFPLAHDVAMTPVEVLERLYRSNWRVGAITIRPSGSLA